MAASRIELAALVAQMNETLSAIRSTIASLDMAHHNGLLDELVRRRDWGIEALLGDYSAGCSSMAQDRELERLVIAERRGIDGGEREQTRRSEDEQRAARIRNEDARVKATLRKCTKKVLDQADHTMSLIEQDAQRMLQEGQEKLRALVEWRKELNHLIDDQL
ncbi:hypothetical protein B0T17DRAFT_618302 [Bombardia bombarda]|uniref:Uncharacterized protein n=1 Tax=Bombardia bombarda TaxID=252184 RepID=A0AA40C2G5_9PEZI|nr:hypothetical protein B0T17DRAFT_618302 [Bombardia bombarda]